jgi:hypothetical protein
MLNVYYLWSRYDLLLSTPPKANIKERSANRRFYHPLPNVRDGKGGANAD